LPERALKKPTPARASNPADRVSFGNLAGIEVSSTLAGDPGGAERENIWKETGGSRDAAKVRMLAGAVRDLAGADQ